MVEILRQLLNALETIGDENEEVYDSEVRERMSNAVFDGFVRPTAAFVLSDEFGMHSGAANQAIKTSLAVYIKAANAEAVNIQLLSFHDRLNAFQNPEIESDGEGAFYDDFFGYSRPEAFDRQGNVVEAY